MPKMETKSMPCSVPFPPNSIWNFNSGDNVAPSTSWQQVPALSVKRQLSDSDCDDVFSEDSSKELCTSPGDSDSCQMLSRKKRRGVIEKKRRDRINMSLSELKRLVPSAFEKQGSTKLEKAEILQMTVDHLKMLHAKGVDSPSFDLQKYAMDYHFTGYRECVAEVSRYLERVEGLDAQNSLRARLTSHLQCYAAQRDILNKPPTAAPWGYGNSQAFSPLNPGHGHPPPNLAPHQPTALHHQNIHPDLVHYDCSQASGSAGPSDVNRLPPGTTLLAPLTAAPSVALPYSPHQYPPVNTFSIPSASHHQNYPQTIATPQGVKPYRPWGAEVAY